MDKDWSQFLTVEPFKGVAFYDVMPVFADPHARDTLVEEMSVAIAKFLDAKAGIDPDSSQNCHSGEYYANLHNRGIDGIIGVDMRGAILASWLAYRHDLQLILVRKPGRLPGPIIQRHYSNEYGEDTLCMQKNAIHKGGNYISIDDLLATGNSLNATNNMTRELGGSIIASAVMLELPMGGRELLEGDNVPLISLRKIKEIEL